jgi:uncharacterized membrane protein
MDMLMIILRLLHIVAGAVWVGFAVFVAFLLGPAIQDSGPEGGKVMGALMRRGMMTAMPLLAITTILSGLWLYWRVSAGFNAAYMGSPAGAMFGAGGALAILGFVLGMSISRPAMMKVGAMMQSLGPATPPDERERTKKAVAQLRAPA